MSGFFNYMNHIQQRVRKDYNYERSPQKFMRFEKIRFKAEELAMLIAELCPEGLELEEALKKTREAAMWAHAGIALAAPELMFPSEEGTVSAHPPSPGG